MRMCQRVQGFRKRVENPECETKLKHVINKHRCTVHFFFFFKTTIRNHGSLSVSNDDHQKRINSNLNLRSKQNYVSS